MSDHTYNNPGSHSALDPRIEENLKEEYRESAREDDKNSLEDDCDVRLVFDQTPCSGLRVLGGWVQLWRFIEDDKWLDDQAFERRLRAGELAPKD